MNIHVTNAVVNGQLSSPSRKLHLNDFMPFAHSQFTHRPTMAKFYHEGLTVLIFTSLKCRSMGLPTDISGNNLNDIVRKHKQILLSFTKKFPWHLTLSDVSLSTVTATHQLPFPVSLHSEHLLYEPELFSAAKLRVVNDNAHVNVFANGKVVLLGIKSQEHADHLLDYLYDCVAKPLNALASQQTIYRPVHEL